VMNLAVVDKIAKAVLYEGYMLYPYRPSSVKNRQRWTFGALCPQTFSEAQKGSDAWTMQTECLVEGKSNAAVEVRVRFLQLVARSVGELTVSVDEISSGAISEFRPVDKLTVAGRVYLPWQEAVEREVGLPVYSLEGLCGCPEHSAFSFSPDTQFEHLRDGSGIIAGVIVRVRELLCGEVEVMAERIEDSLFKVTVRIRNTTPFDVMSKANREEALLSSLVSTHTVLHAENGRFVSLTAPPDAMADSVASCRNVGTWPVLIGEEGQCDTMLSSPIILYDHPQIAPESAGDLFDGTEIDEILSLRIMTLTDEEKREMSNSDERAREMLERTEAMPVEQFMKLHGVLRGLRPFKEGTE
jgi:hypothetical protein